MSRFDSQGRDNTLREVAYRTRKLSAAIAKWRANSGAQIGNYARHVLIQTKPVPALAEYEAWFEATRSSDRRAKPTINGAKVRRAVVMIRGGSSVGEAAKAVGITGGALPKWLDKLPPGLRP